MKLRPDRRRLHIPATAMETVRFYSAHDQIEILLHRNRCLERKLAELETQEMRARHLALHDALTGLPNRRLLQDRFQQAMAQAARHDTLLAVLLIDLDDFKWVNDKLGHSAGDKLLISVVRRLTTAIRSEDTACRYGGDEFVLLLPEISHAHAVNEVVVKLREHMALPYVANGYRIHISLSVGAAIYPADGVTYERLIAHADGAMYHDKTKANGRDMSILMPLDPSTGFDID